MPVTGTQWLPLIFLHDGGFYIVKFKSIHDRDEILYSGSYTINNMPLILKVWSPDFDFKQELPRTMPLWVKFPNLLLKCWGPKTLSKVASRLGNPLFAGECTKKQIRVSFAGVLIDMDMTKYLPLEIKLVDKSGKTFTQDVIYEWRPVFCKTCMMYEHTCKGENVKEN